jgi:hypothetical protein
VNDLGTAPLGLLNLFGQATEVGGEDRGGDGYRHGPEYSNDPARAVMLLAAEPGASPSAAG